MFQLGIWIIIFNYDEKDHSYLYIIYNTMNMYIALVLCIPGICEWYDSDFTRALTSSCVLLKYKK